MKPAKPNPIYLMYMYKKYFTLNNLQWLICHKTNLPTKSISRSNRFVERFFVFHWIMVKSLKKQQLNEHTINMVLSSPGMI